MNKILLTICILIFGIHYTQTYYSQDFNTPGLNGWTSTDLDGDDEEWENTDASGLNSAFGAGSLVSFSFTNATGPLTPDNLITSPLINLSTVTATSVTLLYDMMTHPNYPADKYSVYITTSNSPTDIINSTPVYTEIPTGGFKNKIINLTPYIGQQIYISFRHYDCSDEFYLIIDNIQVKTIADKDVALTKVDLGRYGITNNDYSIKATVKNNGNETLNNITLNWNDGTNDHVSTIALTTPLQSGQEATITHPISVNYPSVVEKTINTIVTLVNGAPDSTPLDNTLPKPFNTVSQNSPKKVVLEEGTGTWCGYCPRGAVAMHDMDTNYPNDFIGIAVHNNDPMQLDEYDSGADFAGFPALHVDRALFNQEVGSSEMANHVNTRKTLVTPAQIDASATLSGNALTITPSATFRTGFSNADFRFSVILVEDDVHGTTSGYNQKNYYSGGALGPMGGYENLPTTVPAAQMTYDHVGRIILGGYTGQAGSIPSILSDGQAASYTFNTTIPATYDTSKIKAVVLLLDATTGEIVNARSFTMNTLGTTEAQTNANYLTIYPNPTTDFIKVQANHNVDLTFYDMSGKLVLQRLNVSPDKNVSVQGLTKGTYLVSIKEKGFETKTKKLIIK
ncbi:choice-of-anchor J domain-containing protein [Chryseobacterium sp. ERMR1:04]|uniref:T9SS-dependent choice-of-anchor J family protein n=1 Tax=Chryseobacterium sp. ERMR1:04 TaxID=1705393 RepID=UPI0006C891BC|nr:choice-of-anchor J domain-containing protein [Chryseobacterium sp. ERMR1:04]KPH12623.1 hypothetical protein AMQ68_17205 [Chryseobacterium sp. ERMR1:04]